MNKCTIIGNVTKKPELRVTQTGINVCSFSVAVNRKKTQSNQDPGTDYFNVTAWRGLGEICARYLDKGKKVCCVGAVSVRTYQASDGSTRASLELTADDVEFLSPSNTDQQTGMTVVDEEFPL